MKQTAKSFAIPAEAPRRIRLLKLSLIQGCCLCATGCVTPGVVFMEAQRYKIDVSLDPAAHTLKGHAALDLSRVGDPPGAPDQPAAFAILLHEDLSITRIDGAGAKARLLTPVELKPLRKGKANEAPGISEDAEAPPRRHWVRIDRPVDSMTLLVSFEGKLQQDVSQGEKPGEIHNFSMRAHIGEEGIYLADGYWYPEPELAPDNIPPLAHFTLSTGDIPDMALVASGDEDEDAEDETGRKVWQSPYPIQKMVLVGGRNSVHKAEHNGVELAVHVRLSNEDQAEGLLAAAKRNLDRYVPLMGPYPARQYTIVENFFSSGFAFPCFTLLSSAVIQMGERGWGRHGYLDHEFLHSWWGAGVHVDPRDGNWCESLASYGANYYGFVLDGDEEGARKKRRNICHFLSRIKPEDDKPLGTYGLPGGCSRSIAYDKGAMVFHMLERRMGAEKLWASLKAFNNKYMGEYASWVDLQNQIEAHGVPQRSWNNEAQQDNETTFRFSTFFDQWVRREGCPQIDLYEAEQIDSGGIRLYLRQNPVFSLYDVAVRTVNAERPDLNLHLQQQDEAIEYKAQFIIWPLSIELDPDYHTLRCVPPDMIFPTTTSTKSGNAFTAVLPAGDVPEELSKLAKNFAESFKEKDALILSAGQIQADQHLAERCLLILGEAVRDPVIEGFLAAADFPLGWSPNGFRFEGEYFEDAGHAVLCTERHPGVPGGGITVVYGNSEAALPRAQLVPFYENSMLIFKDGIPVLRRDFEPRRISEVRQATP